MAKNCVKGGYNTTTFVAPTGGVVSGVLVVIGAMAVIPAVTVTAQEVTDAGADGVLFEGHTDGEWELTAAGASEPGQGDKAYFDGTEITAAADNGADTNFTPVGYFTAAKANGVTTARVMLCQGVPGDGAY